MELELETTYLYSPVMTVAYETAFEMCDAKVSVSVIIDLRKEIDADLLAKAQSRGIVVHLNSSISKTYGKLRINAFEVFEPDAK